MEIRPFLSAALDLILPHRCVGCEALVDTQGFCRSCAVTLEPSEEFVLASEDGRPHVVVAEAYEHGGALATAIRRFKYSGALHLQAALGALLSAPSPLRSVDLVIPVPLHRARLRKRGFNQSSLLARPLAYRLGCPVDYGSLRRLRATRPQVGLGRDERLRNMAGAFCAEGPLDGKVVLLVDDVITSGATVGACATALIHAGAAAVGVSTLSCPSTPLKMRR